MYQFCIEKTTRDLKNPNRSFFDTPLQVEILLSSQDVVTEIKLDHDFRFFETTGRKIKHQFLMESGITNLLDLRCKVEVLKYLVLRTLNICLYCSKTLPERLLKLSSSVLNAKLLHK